ncbi:MAG: exodeoxyribonuclease VII small subunit [Bacteroidales bacterium]|jgi:exodeoxyribonuclease VII small subunit|nr:exodeoxyribonuclease VII small subunit [Bacteroidales bacterium]
MTKKELSFTQAMSEVEAILGKMERGEMDIDELSAGVKRASELLRFCQKKLKTTEEEIEKIFREE